MNHIYYSIYDRLAEMYGPLNELANDNVAKRTFLEACRAADGYKQHPQDLEIHRIGVYDDFTGKFDQLKEIIAKGEPNEV